MTAQRDIEAVDAFAGPGGWDVALRALGIDPLGIEWDDAACATRAAVGLRTLPADVAALDPLDFAPCEDEEAERLGLDKLCWEPGEDSCEHHAAEIGRPTMLLTALERLDALYLAVEGEVERITPGRLRSRLEEILVAAGEKREADHVV